MPGAAGFAVAIWPDVHSQLSRLTLGPVHLPRWHLQRRAPAAGLPQPAHMLSFWRPGGRVHPCPGIRAAVPQVFADCGSCAAMPDSYRICKLMPPSDAAVSNTKDNPPCNTLFIGNLGDSVSEAELRSVFSILPGFQQIKLGKNNRNISCFVEFRDLASAMGCHQSQQVGQWGVGHERALKSMIKSGALCCAHCARLRCAGLVPANYMLTEVYIASDSPTEGTMGMAAPLLV